MLLLYSSICADACGYIGCGSQSANEGSPSAEIGNNNSFNLDESDGAGVDEDNSFESGIADDQSAEYVHANLEEEEVQQSEEDTIKEEHLKSFSMMYYLAIAAEEIRSSRDNRLVLEDIYTTLLNDINPGAVDDITQDHMENLRDIIKDYRSIAVKKERLQYIYNQDKAAAIRSAIPNPLAILSMTNAYDWKKLAVSVVYSAVDSYNNYKSAKENADKSFLMSGWELEDEAVLAVQKNRDRAFDYMVDMVQKYHLEGTLTLNEKAIERFVEICEIESVQEKTRRLESEKDTYKYLGNYWLELADCYFETGKYEKCLESVDRYNELYTGIYRQDFNYVKILPKAIVAAQNVYSNQSDQYIARTGEYADSILKNTQKDEENWSVRYFAAQIYLDLYSRTGENQYRKKAYDIIYDNVTLLLQGQRDLNTAYMEKVKEVTVETPDYSSLSEEDKKKEKKEHKDEKKRAKEYNEALKKKRKTELPALYEPLVLNCELLFALADELNITDEEKADLEAILQTETNGIFLSKPINDAYSFSRRDNHYNIEMTTDELIIPADLMTADSSLKIMVTGNNQTEVFDDCKVTRVKREGKSIDSFIAHVSSKKIKKYDWTADTKVVVEITYHDAFERTAEYKFRVDDFEDHWYGDKVVFKAE